MLLGNHADCSLLCLDLHPLRMQSDCQRMAELLLVVQERLAALLEERKKMGESLPEQPASKSPTKNSHRVQCTAISAAPHAVIAPHPVQQGIAAQLPDLPPFAATCSMSRTQTMHDGKRGHKIVGVSMADETDLCALRPLR